MQNSRPILPTKVGKLPHLVFVRVESVQTKALQMFGAGVYSLDLVERVVSEN